MLDQTMVDKCSISNAVENEDGLVVVINDEDVVSLDDVNSPTDVSVEAASKKRSVYEQTMVCTLFWMSLPRPAFLATRAFV